ncbi:hypothetical protein D7252_18025 [Microbacterium sp. CGR2]|nr:hypothetical protein D7252_18025 [Microbacterium sp. CGR2]
MVIGGVMQVCVSGLVLTMAGSGCRPEREPSGMIEMRQKRHVERARMLPTLERGIRRWYLIRCVHHCPIDTESNDPTLGSLRGAMGQRFGLDAMRQG